MPCSRISDVFCPVPPLCWKDSALRDLDFRTLRLDEVLSEGDGDGFRTVRGTEFNEDGVDVLLYAVFANAKLLGDVGIGEAARDGMENLGLTWREVGHGRIFGELTFDLGRNHASTGGKGTDGRDEF